MAHCHGKPQKPDLSSREEAQPPSLLPTSPTAQRGRGFESSSFRIDAGELVRSRGADKPWVKVKRQAVVGDMKGMGVARRSRRKGHLWSSIS